MPEPKTTIVTPFSPIPGDTESIDMAAKTTCVESTTLGMDNMERSSTSTVFLMIFILVHTQFKVN